MPKRRRNPRSKKPAETDYATVMDSCLEAAASYYNCDRTGCDCGYGELHINKAAAQLGTVTDMQTAKAFVDGFLVAAGLFDIDFDNSYGTAFGSLIVCPVRTSAQNIGRTTL